MAWFIKWAETPQRAIFNSAQVVQDSSSGLVAVRAVGQPIGKLLFPLSPGSRLERVPEYGWPGNTDPAFGIA